MTDLDIGIAAQRVRDIIRNDVRGGFSALVDFANENAATPRLKREALLLKFKQHEVPPGTELNELERRMVELVRRIEDDHREHWRNSDVATEQRTLRQVREHLLNDQPVTTPVCVARGLGKRYRGTDFQLQGVDLELRPGEVTAVVGQNSHGKTTLLRIAAGELRQSEGTLEYPLLSGAADLSWPAIKAEVAYLPQDLPPWAGALKDNLHFAAALHGVLGEDNEREVAFFIQRLGLGEHLNKRWSQLSGGTKLRFALARVLIWKPKLLVLDEPLANLDVLAQSRLLQDILDLARSPRYPLAVLMSSQHLHELEAVASVVVFLRGGDVEFNGPVRDIGSERSHNVYELGTSVELARLKELFHDQRFEEPSHNGVSYVIKTRVDVGAAQVLRELLEAGVDVKYFRDISQSIKSLFE